MAYNNAWANHRLLAAAGKLVTSAFLDATRTSFFPSISQTLNHNVTVDWFYVDALERALGGAEVNPDARRFFEPEEPFRDCASLAAAQRAVDRRLVLLCVALDEHKLETRVGIQRRTGVVYDSAMRILAHLFQHQIHHRGQAHAMFAGTSVPPPQLDEFFCANEANLRAAELSQLGYSEALIWGSVAEK